tara:strand:+ start:1704 stop:2762 length:1059 start_codon:yes stop_codon:yes gene_type:complete
MPFLGNKPTNNFTSFEKQDITGSGTTSYTLAHAVNNEKDIDLYINHVHQEPTTAYSASGTTLTLTESISSSDDCYVLFRSRAILSATPPDGSVTSAKLATNIQADTLYGKTTDGDSGINLATNDNVKIDIAGSTKVTVDGTHVKHNDGSGNARFGIDNDNMLLINEDTEAALYLNGTTVFYAEPNGKQTIYGNVANYALSVINDGNDNNRLGIRIKIGEDSGSATNYLCGFQDGDGNSVGSITFSGSNTSFNTASDYRLKSNIADLTDATTKLKKLKPKKFSWTRDTSNKLIHGFLAHEVSPVVPEAVIGEKDAKDADGNPEYQQVDQSKLVPLLVKTIQELEARITKLEGK